MTQVCTAKWTTPKESKRIVGAGPPFLADFTNDKPKGPFVKKSEGILKNKQEEIEELGEVKRKEVIGNSIDGAIVESILGNAPTAEETDPQTRCQSKCGKNEVCQISGGGRDITCKCRPGFGKARPGSSCESECAIQI